MYSLRNGWLGDTDPFLCPSEETVVIDLGDVAVDSEIAARIPDAGAFLLQELPITDEGIFRAVEASIDRLRHANGAITGKRLSEIGSRNWKAGPVTHLAWLTAQDGIILEVWASFGLGRREGKRIGQQVLQVYLMQGIPAAATWAFRSRPNARLDLDSLVGQLTGSRIEWMGKLTNGDIIKSFKKWRPDER